MAETETSRMAYRVEYLAADRAYAASLDTLRDALLFAASRNEAETASVQRVTGPEGLLLEGDELDDAIANPPEPDTTPADDLEET